MDLIQSRFQDFLEAYTRFAEENNLSGSEVDETMKCIHEYYKRLIEACTTAIESNHILEEKTAELKRLNEVYIEKVKQLETCMKKS